jgi:hypothetical protein
MKPIVTKKTVKTFGKTNQQRSSGFNIKQSKEMFMMLSSQLYSDKILAVIREISANAVDSHVEKGCPELPISVHLPNTLEPWFTVRDFGVGLSQDDMMELYTTYGDSRKRDTNEQTGMLGVGSKSPFAYAESFNVTSWFDGTKSVYTCNIEEDGLPRLKLIADEKCDINDTGLEVQIAVEQKDFNAFKEKAVEVYQHYHVFPKIKGSTIELKPFEYESEFDLGDGITVKKRKWKQDLSYYDSGLKKAVLRQGACVYPIKFQQIKDPYAGQYSSSPYRLVTGNCIEIEVPIGSVNITADRERLEYDKHTVKFLRDLCEKADTMFQQAAQKDLNKCKNIWEACQKSGEILEKYPNSDYGLWSRKVKFNDQSIDDLSRYGITLNFHLKTATGSTKQLANIKTLSKSDLRAKGVKARLYNEGGTSKVKPSNNPRIVFQDSADTYRNKRRKLLWNMYEKIEDKEEAKREVYYIEVFDSLREAQALKKLKKDLEGAEIILMSQLPNPPKVTKAGGTKRNNSIMVLESQRINWQQTKYKWVDAPSDIDETSGGYYVNVNVSTPDVGLDCGNLLEIIADARRLGYLSQDEVVYGIPASYKKIPEKNTGWIHLGDFLKKKLKQRLKNFDVKAEFRAMEEKRCAEQADILNFNLLFDDIAYDIPKELKEVRKEIALKKKYVESKLIGHMALLKTLDISDNSGILPSSDYSFDHSEFKVTKLADKLNEKFPLVNAFDRWQINKYRDDIIDYVYMIDKKVDTKVN